MDQPLRHLETGPENELRRIFLKERKELEPGEASACPVHGREAWEGSLLDRDVADFFEFLHISNDRLENVPEDKGFRLFFYGSSDGFGEIGSSCLQLTGPLPAELVDCRDARSRPAAVCPR